LDEQAAQAALCDYRGAVEALLQRRAELERLIAAAVGGSPFEREVARLRCLRGIDTLSAVGLCAEIGDFARFAGAGRLMSYVGLVPSEHSSGERRRQGPITKTGSRHARRLLVEAAWNYRYRPRVGRALEGRQRGQPAAAIAISWSAQRRLNRTWTRLRAQGKRAPVVTVAVARELAGFCWAITTIEEDEH
jgi:transposase